MELQARIWRGEGRFKDARSEILRAVDVFERLGAATALEACRYILWGIEGKMKELATSSESLETALPHASINSPL